MNILGIDTATEIASVGISNDQARGITRPCHHTLSRELVNMIDQVLGTSGKTLAQLDGLAVSIGPGSFTGLRIGLATAQGLALSVGLPLVPVRTLDALACQVTKTIHPVAVVQKARKGEVYFAQYALKKTVLEKVISEKVVAVQHMGQEITEPVVLIGNAYDQVLPLVDPGNIVPIKDPIKPSGMAVAQLGSSLINESTLDKNDQLEPYYIKEPDARVMKK